MTDTAIKTKTERQARTFRPILASSDGDKLPTRIELLKIGMWDTPNHGMFMVTEEDLNEYKSNFDAGVAQSGDAGIMIDYDHNKGIAAGWIKGLEIAPDSKGVMTLFADPVEWTGVGKKDLLEKNYKCISPEFYPASRGGWEDPEEYGHYIPNVLAAAGLVNRPLFKGLQPIMASEDSGKSREERNIIYVSASEKEKSMTLAEVRAKDVSSLTEEEQSFLVEHKAELTADEQKKFGFETSEAETEEQKKEREAQEAAAKKAEEEKVAAEAKAAEEARNSAPDLTNAQPVMASAIKGDEGKVVVEASALKELHDKALASDKKEAEALVQSHIARGAIKADQLNGMTTMLMSARGEQRTQLEDMMKNLPDNKVLAGELGSADKGGEAKTAREQILDKANAAIKASADAGETLDMRGAISKVRKENPELAKEYDAELEGK